MSGRNGADRLGLTLLWTGLILYILGTLIGAFWMLLGSLLNLAGSACLSVPCTSAACSAAI